MRKRLLACLMTVSMLLTLLPISALAGDTDEGSVSTGTPQTYLQLAGVAGEGTQESPYLVASSSLSSLSSYFTENAATPPAETVYLQAVENITLPEDTHISFPEGFTIVLDFNGYTLTKTDNSTSAPIENYANLSIQDTSASGSGGISGGNRCINNYGTMQIYGGNFSTTSHAGGTAIRNSTADSVMTIYDCTVNAAFYAIYNYGTMTVENGTFTSSSCNHTGNWAYCFSSEGKLYFKNGSVTGVQGALSIANGYAEIYDGQFKTVICSECKNPARSFYGLYIAGEYGEVEAHVYGGTYQSAGYSAVLCGNDNTGGDGGINAKATAIIEGGIFIGASASTALTAGKNTGDPTITGGRFSTNEVGGQTPRLTLQDFAAPYCSVTEENGMWVVTPNTAENSVAEIDGNYFTTLPGAIAAAKSGDTVELLKDVTVSEPIWIDKDITLDLNTKTLTNTFTASADASGTGRFSLITTADVTIQNGTYASTGVATEEVDTRGICQSQGDLTLTSVVTTCNGINVCNYATSGTLTISDCQISGDYAVGSFADLSTVKITDSKLTGTTCGLYHNGSYYGLDLTVTKTKIIGGPENKEDGSGVYLSGSTTTTQANGGKNQQAVFTDCEISGATGIEVKFTDLTLNNCSVVTTSDSEPTFAQYNNGSTTTGFSVVASDNTMAPDSPAPSGTITINGSHYDGLVGLKSLINPSEYPNFREATYVITGGTFTDKPSDSYLGTGLTFTAEDETNGPWTVIPADGMSADAEVKGDTATAEVGGNFNGKENEDNSNNVSTENKTIQINVVTDEDTEGNPTPNDTVTSSEVTIQGASLSSVQQTSGISSVEIATDVGTVTLTKRAWDTITDNAIEAADGNDPAPVTLIISSIVEEGQVTGVELTATANGSEVFSSKNSGNAAITVSVPVPRQLNADTIQVYYMSPTGPQPVDAQVSGRNLVWTVNHFSEYRFTSGSDAACLTNSNGDSVFYYSLQDAINAAQLDSIVSLLKDVTLDGAGKGNTQGVLTIDGKDIILNGNGHTIDAQNVTFDADGKGPSMINVQNGADVTIQNLVIDGGKAAKHGLNLYQASATLEQVKIINNRWYAVVVNGSELDVNGLTTSDNQWGINVDNTSGLASLNITNANISEDSSVVFDKSDEDGNAPTARISGGSFRDIVFNDGEGSATLTISGGTFRTAGTTNAISVSDYLEEGLSWNPSTGTVYNPSDVPTRPSQPSGGGSSVDDYYIDVSSSGNGKVTAYPGRAEAGDTVTLTVKPDSGYELSELTVTTSSRKTVKLTPAGENKYTFTMPSGTISVKASFARIETSSPVIPSASFTDVSAGVWYYNAVNYVVTEGIMSGTGSNTFSPNASLTRGMAAQMLYAMAGKPSQGSSSYTDVSASAWYADAVAWVSAKGVMTGYGAGLFAPDTPVTREQLALILFNYAKLQGYDTSASSSLSVFADGASVASWAQQAMSWAVAEGLFSGRDGNMLAPAGTATRAEIAQIFMQFCSNVAD